MTELKNVENEEIVEIEEVEKVGFFTKMGKGIKKNAKTIAGVAVVVTVGLVAYTVGKKSNGFEIPVVDESLIDITDSM